MVQFAPGVEVQLTAPGVQFAPGVKVQLRSPGVEVQLTAPGVQELIIEFIVDTGTSERCRTGGPL